MNNINLQYQLKSSSINPIWVATRNAKKFSATFNSMINWSSIILVGVLFLFSSCTTSDTIENIENEAPIENQALIIYTDIKPDFVSSNLNANYDLDLNNDGITEYTFSLWTDVVSDFLLMKSPPESNNAIISVVPWYLAGINPVTYRLSFFETRSSRFSPLPSTAFTGSCLCTTR